MEENTPSPNKVPDDMAFQKETNPPRRILVVDDDEALLRLNVEVLTNAGYHVDSAQDGAAAWNALQLNTYDLLITDQKMPKISGTDLLAKLHAAGVELPVILTTGVWPWDELRRQPWLQVETFLMKPFSVVDLLAAVENVLRESDHTTGQVAPPPNRKDQQPPDDLRRR